MPKELFHSGEASTPLFHKLIDAMTTEVDSLLKIYAAIRIEDSFVDSFCRIVESVYVQGHKNIKNSLRAYVTRNDFIVHIDGATDEEEVEQRRVTGSDASSNKKLSLKQVEINLSSVVGPHTMQELSELHRQLVIPEYRSKLPPNRPRAGLVESLRVINDVYRLKVGDGQRQCILWVIGSFESNLPEILTCVDELRSRTSGITVKNKVAVSDQSPELSSLDNSSGIHRHNTMDTAGTPYSPLESAESTDSTRVFVVTWDDLTNKMSSLKFESQRMYFNPADFLYNEESYPYEVSVVYFRTGYAPHHYQTQNHWKLREKMEECECAVIPSAISQLVGLKKAQQVWSRPGFVDRFESLSSLADFFMPQADLNDSDSETLTLIRDAKEHPENYVLKPQREGGGNNVYGLDIVEALEASAANKGKNSQILMAKINSPETLTEIYTNDVLSVHSCISEIGYFGVACFNGPQQVLNENIGYLLRTKNAASDEGGISVNAAVFDSIMLV